MSSRVQILKLPTGVPGLDEVLGGGLPEYSFNLVGGGPGCGKTTLAHQVMFANASPERPALYVTVVGEPPLKMLRYQQQFDFYDVSKIGSSIRLLHLGDVLLERGLDAVLQAIVDEVQSSRPRLVVVDSFRSVLQKAQEPGQMGLSHFIQRLGLHLTSWEATSFLIGEYLALDESNPLFSVADGIVWMSQEVNRGSVTRKLQVVKIRGQREIPGLHSCSMSSAGLRVFPRLRRDVTHERLEHAPPDKRLAVGVDDLDAMLGGGIPAGNTVLVAGPSGTGKTTLSSQFIVAGARAGENGVLAIFDRRPPHYLRTAGRGREIDEFVRSGKVKLLYLGSQEISADEAFDIIRETVRETKANRLVIDSLSGFELAVSPALREDSREGLYRMIDALTDLGVTVMLTTETSESTTELRLSPHGVSFMADGVILMRYIELEGELRRVLVVAKMRATNHSRELRAFDITSEGIVLTSTMREYSGVLTGLPKRIAPADEPSANTPSGV